MEITPGKYFEIVYKLLRVNADGTETLVHEVEADDPDSGVCGLTPGFVEALEEELIGKKPGDRFDFVAPADKAFGPYTEEEIYNIPREQMTVDGKFDESMFTPGALIPLMGPGGIRIDGTVVRLTPEAVVLDLNHPLAKDPVHFVGSVLTVRDATADEIAECTAAAGCGGGCGGGCCGGGEESSSCGGGCCGGCN